ncbi:MAG: glycosyltransferase [Phycisphaerae bacterium]
MIRGRTIICVASNWEVDPTSKHHVMQLLARDNHVLWVSYNGSRRPTTTVADLGLAASVLRRVFRGPQRITDTMLQFTPLVIPGAHAGPGARLNRRMLTAQIKRALHRLNPTADQPLQLWLFTPDVSFLAGRFNEEIVVYYCVDEHTEFSGYDPLAVRAAENRLLDRADVVLTSSQALLEAKSALHPNVHLIRHGVDVEHFARALNPRVPPPQEVADLPRPIVGFFGLIHHWIDIDLIAAVAKRLPQMHFVLIGHVVADVRALRPLPNVSLLGRKPYRDLPAYCAAFDVAILPFKGTELTRNANPIKLREYLAAGLPVVSTPLPEVSRYRPEVVIAEHPDCFAKACAQAARRSSIEDRIRRSKRVSGESWQAVVDKIGPLVMKTPRVAPVQPHGHPLSPHGQHGPRVGLLA